MLKDQTLSYYKSPKDTTPVGIIPMDDIIKTAIYTGEIEIDSTSWVIQILTKKSNEKKGGEFLISCENENEMNDWIDAINFATRSEQVHFFLNSFYIYFEKLFLKTKKRIYIKVAILIKNTP